MARMILIHGGVHGAWCWQMTPLSLTPGGYGSVPKTYLATTWDGAVPLTLQHKMARDADAEIVEIDSDHSPFVSAVRPLADALDAAARS